MGLFPRKWSLLNLAFPEQIPHAQQTVHYIVMVGSALTKKVSLNDLPSWVALCGKRPNSRCSTSPPDKTGIVSVASALIQIRLRSSDCIGALRGRRDKTHPECSIDPTPFLGGCGHNAQAEQNMPSMCSPALSAQHKEQTPTTACSYGTAAVQRGMHAAARSRLRFCSDRPSQC